MSMPDEELRVCPKWLLFDNDYTRVQRAVITIYNTNKNHNVVYRIRGNHSRDFRVPRQCGHIGADQSRKVEIFLEPDCFIWGAKGNKYRFVVESLYPPDGPIGNIKDIFKQATKDGVLPIYIKVNAILPEPPEEHSPKTHKATSPPEQLSVIVTELDEFLKELLEEDVFAGGKTSFGSLKELLQNGLQDEATQVGSFEEIQIGSFEDITQVGSFEETTPDGSLKDLMQVGSLEEIQVRSFEEVTQVGSFEETTPDGSLKELMQVGSLEEATQIGSFEEITQVRIFKETTQIGSLEKTTQIGLLKEVAKIILLEETTQTGSLQETTLGESLEEVTQVGSFEEATQIGLLKEDDTRVEWLEEMTQIGSFEELTQDFSIED